MPRIRHILAPLPPWIKQHSTIETDDGINIRVGRAYRLLRTLQLPRMPTDKAFRTISLAIMVNIPIIFIETLTRSLLIGCVLALYHNGRKQA
jgi:hypothetical protein